MTIYIQNKIKKDNYYNYLKENSNWIKELSRSDNNINNFIEFIKDKYSLKLTDRLNNTLDKIDMINKVLTIIK